MLALLCLARAATAQPAAATVTADESGFALRSADGEFALRIRGDALADGRFFIGDETQTSVDQFYLRLARLVFQATLSGRYDVRIQPNFGQGRVELQDAYVDARFHPAFALKAGKFKVPVGLEWLRSVNDLALLEFGLPSALVPRRDVGVVVHGTVAAGLLTYDAGVFNGVPDGQNSDGDVTDSKDAAVRLFAQPFRSAGGPLRGLGMGIAATAGTDAGTAALPEVAGYRTIGGRSIFRYRATAADSTTARADGTRLRVSPQAYFFSGPASLLGEVVVSRQETRVGAAVADLQASAWQVIGTVILTGENATLGRLRPARPLGVGGGLGAVEVAARYGAIHLDDDAFPVFANPATSARAVHEWAAGVNWYPSAQVRLSASVERTLFDSSDAAPPGTSFPDETLLTTRFQITF